MKRHGLRLDGAPYPAPDLDLLGAHRAGIREVIIPKANEADLEDVPEEVQKQLVFHPVETLREVLDIALLQDDRD